MLDLMGRNICILDVETRVSAQSCRHCGYAPEAHGEGGYCPLEAGSEFWNDHYTAIGWEDYARLGLSIGCWFDCAENLPHWFDIHTLDATLRTWVASHPLLVSFNGKAFDFPLLCHLWAKHPRTRDEADQPHPRVGEQFLALAERSYDLLHAIFELDPARKFEKGLNSLEALSKANGLPHKQMDGATAPTLWKEGRIAEVLEYCQRDVLNTKALFELVCAGQPIIRGDGLPITLPLPNLEHV